MLERVLVRACAGEPLERVVCDVDRRAVYVARPDLANAVRAGASRPVGFPSEDVFRFDAALHARLDDQWRREGRTDPDLWSQGVPYLGA